MSNAKRYGESYLDKLEAMESQFGRCEKSFSELDFSLVDFNNGSWSWGAGGYPFQDGEYFISFTDENLNETRYKLPKCISEMLRLQFKFGGQKKLGEIRHALEI